MSSDRHPRVLVAGGGVAAAEALLALRSELDGTIELELLTPELELVHRPSTVAAPFGLSGPAPIALSSLASGLGATLRPGWLRRVHPARHEISTDQGDVLGYDVLVVATGARWSNAVHGATVFHG